MNVEGTAVSVSISTSAAAAIDDAPQSSSYTFAASEPPHVYPSLTGERWIKWGLAARTRAVRVSVTGGGRGLGSGGDAAAFLSDLLNSAALRDALRPPDAQGKSCALPEHVRSVRATALSVTETSLSFFDALVRAGALGTSAAADSAAAPRTFIRKRFEEPYFNLPIVDCAREALVLPGDDEECGEDDPNGDAVALSQPQRFGGAFTQGDRAQVLFRLARWVVAGGGMCQYEDEWEPYAGAVKDLARDLLTVTRAPGDGGGIVVASHAWLVRALESDGGGAVGLRGGGGLFAVDSPHNLCLIVADPLKRCVHVLHHSWIPFW